MSNLLFTLNAILPILIPILLGYFLRKINFLSDEFLAKANKFVFTVFIPILLFKSLYLKDLSNLDMKFIGFVAIAILILFGIGVIVALFFPDKKQKGVIVQASFRSNYAIIGIPLATMLGGSEAEAQAAIVAAVSVPLFNILAVIALTMYDHEDGQKVNIKNTLYKIVTNPLIIGVALGLLVCGINSLIGIEAVNNFFHGPNASTNGMKFVYSTIESLGNVATPLALVILGGRFKFTAVKKLWKQLTVSVVLRLVITPLIFLVIAYFIGFKSPTEFAILIALFGTPIAVSSAPMAAQMNQDEELAGQIVVWTSAFSAISLFIIILICAAIGIF